MWVMADQEGAKETVNERLIPFLEDIQDVRERMPQARDERKSLLVKFTNMNVYVRGSNSKAKLQSTPVMYLLLDEVRNYRKGALELVLKRTRAFRRSKTVYISTAMEEDDAVHRIWKDGTRTFLYWPCPKCGHSQPFRFGREESPIYGKKREKGGFRWLENETTRPNGKWNYGEVAKTIYYECENCGEHIFEHQKFDLLSKVKRVDTNTTPAPGHFSMHTWVAYVIWVPWKDPVIEFMKAMDAVRCGDFEPFKAFIRETLGEPWRLKGVKADDEAMNARKGPYLRGQLMQCLPGETARILTVDVQKEAQILKYVYRQWRVGGSSRLIDYGIFSGLDDVRAYQEKNGIKSKLVGIDTGHKAREIYPLCLRYGWIAIKGDKEEHYAVRNKETKKTTYNPFRESTIDPFSGTTAAGRTTLQLLRFSSPTYKDRLYLLVCRGQGAPWEIPSDIGQDYMSELTSDEYVIVEGKPKWIERGVNDFGDCEQMQLLLADKYRLSRTIVVDKKPESTDSAQPQPVLAA